MARNKPASSDSVYFHRLGQLLSFTCLLATLVVNPWGNYDPICLPKMLVVSIGAFAGILLLASKRPYSFKRDSKLDFIFFLFLVGLAIPIVFASAPLTQQLWGVFGRNSGLLTYVSLLILMFICYKSQNTIVYSRILGVFVLSTIPITIYCLLQFFKLDPIPWSEKFVFGTLGNVNFLSAFISMTSVALVALVGMNSISKKTKGLMLGMAFLDMALALSTKSIQGPIIFAVGIATLPLIRFISAKEKSILRISLYLIFLVTSFVTLAFAVLNKGPLAKFVFQPSIIFRGDYMHAGWKMFLEFPITGVGMDSYGDWYRYSRGEISTLRTGPGRISNTAHNIFLDVASNGGIVLAFAYLTLLLLTVLSIVRLVRTGKALNPIVAAFISVWFAYQVQALVSINMIGVGVWGWVFAGVIIGMDRGLTIEEVQNWVHLKIEGRKSLRGKPLAPRQFVFATLGAFIGFALASPPWFADLAYRAASNKGKFEAIYQSTHRLGSTEQHRELLLNLASSNQMPSETRLVADELVRDYPRSFYGWRVLSAAVASTPAERVRALEVARQLDPFNPELK